MCHWFIRQSDNSYRLERRYWSAFGFVNNLGAADPYNFINFFTGMGAGEFLMRMMAFRMKKSFGHVYRIFQTGSDREVRDAVNSVY